MRRALITLAVLPLFNNSAVASGPLNDVQLDNVCSGSAACCPSALCNSNPFALVARVELLGPNDNNKADLATGAARSAPAAYTLLTGPAAAAEVRALMGSK